MRPTDNIKNFIEKSSISSNPKISKIVLDELIEEMKKDKHTGASLNMWSKFMKSPMIKPAIAACVIIAAVLALYIADKSVSPAWAIEQSIEAMEKYYAVHITGKTVIEDSERDYEIWATTDANGLESKNCRFEIKGYKITVTKGNKSWDYDIKNNSVHISEGQGLFISPWIGSNLFRWLRDGAYGIKVNDWKVTYGKDPATNRERAYVTCSHPEANPKCEPRSWWFEFDVESKLLVSLKQWNNFERKGAPSLDAEKITFFEELPDEMFNFEIPADANVIKQ